ncbi:prolyl 4-hydroxylase alpha subunit [Emiliania huxleyi CCMP1516]|uniref:Prolyl 4-hydroxylase alpha subunit Fe(2+) 2OG dioxygenase domain-containing protein n=2 Tax=Emiliania huxleyi TaxID=2903 RepID=A0A0D3L1R5_EMIH1|nr:prolyl 4-hydroxylase alpha subunit [Emiliania huxleyi CCMP1516]EOD41950.1 prolyl 4-hydroxylase alpha subunit [Emiliania huxleyi CCMP1516]|eukprot:XP_005794379.1 prolyl 4-hydroxylase alpha subunit [Emiliania huxleyi CCMP1516]
MSRARRSQTGSLRSSCIKTGAPQRATSCVRIFTLFMYLNDVPEGGGGGTRFTDLKPEPITFMPSRGKAVLWPSVLADAPDTMDPRTHHEALPVWSGEKFGANFWIHQYDFRSAHASGCTMG